MNFSIINRAEIPPALQKISEKVSQNQRITASEALLLYGSNHLGLLAVVSHAIREKRHGKKTFFNRNFHIEPTNICIYNCQFCSYSRKTGQQGAWEHSLGQIEQLARRHKNKPVSEVHIVGGVHPNRDLHYYGEMIQRIKAILPEIHIKAFTAVELDFMIKKAHLPLDKGLQKLKEYGLDSIPGGGAEIFDKKIRQQICHEKSDADQWLRVHQTAHENAIPSNATMLYGHIENYHHRIDHLSRLRQLQDKTHGFNAFIPLKYRKANNSLSHIGEVPLIEDLKNFAISRIFLDNFDHIKAYWPMLGKQNTQLALSFGVDDIDGTIEDTTKIYSMAGADDQKPAMALDEIVQLIAQAGLKPVERDTLYNILNEF